jgi:hypothetical protein
MPYDKFEQAAPIEVLPNIQPQVDESMIRAVQTASQAFEARAKRKQEGEEAASAAKAAERKRLLEIKAPTGTSPIAAFQNAMTQTSNEAYNAAIEGKPTALYEAKIKDLEGKGQSLTQFTTNIGGVMGKSKETYGAAFETPEEYEKYVGIIGNPNASIDEVYEAKNKLESKLATPYKTLNFGKLGDIYLDENKNAGYATNIQRGLTTTGQTIQSRIWVTDPTKPLVINGQTQKDANGDVIYEQRPAANWADTKQAASKFLQSRDGAVGTMLAQKIQEEDAKSINDELNTKIEEYKKANWNAPMAKPTEPSETWKEAAKKGIIDRKVLEKAQDIMWDNQQAYVSAYGVTKKEPSKASGSGAGEKEKVTKVTTARNTTYPEIFYNRTTGKIETGVKQTLGEVIYTDKNGKLPVLELDGAVKNVTINDGEILKTPVTTQMTKAIPLVYNKETGAVEHIPEGLNMLQWLKKQTPEKLAKLNVQPYAYMKSGIKGKDGLFESTPEMDESKLSRYYNLKENKKRTQEEEKEFNELKIEFNSKTRLYRQEYSKIYSKLKASGFDAPEPNNAFYKDPQLQRDFEEAKEIIRRGSAQQKTTPTPAKSGGTKGGGTPETTKTGGTAAKGKIKIVGTKPLVNFNQ